jgi:ankyrin repeat protein
MEKFTLKLKAVSAVIFSILVFIYFTNGFSAATYKLLQVSAETGNTRIAELLLAVGTPASPRKSMYEWYYLAELTDAPLHSAAKTGNLALAKSLIAYGANINWCCCSCVTPLHDAIRHKNYEMVNLLLNSGADIKVSYDLTYTVIELAKKESTPEIVGLLEQRITSR